jgi:hypothetical protein
MRLMETALIVIETGLEMQFVVRSQPQREHLALTSKKLDLPDTPSIYIILVI